MSVLGGHLTDCNNLVGFSVCIKLETIYIYIYNNNNDFIIF